jgi:glycosyltransferase involved in cell wall biosynthesis
MKISIIIPCYNAEKWVSESIISALRQTYENLEIIFVDNESTDNSLQIAKDIQKQHPKLKVLTAPNLFKYSWEEPVEEALKIATGEYFTILGADDFLKKDYVTEVCEILDVGKGRIKLLQSPIMGVEGNTGSLSGQLSHKYKNLKEFKSLLFEKCPVTTPSMIYSKDLHDKGIIRWKSKEYLGAVDYELYFNFADKGLFIYPFNRWLGYHYRWHPEQATWGMRKEETDFEQKIKEHWKSKWKLG